MNFFNLARIERVAQAIAQEVESQHGKHDRHAREKDHVWLLAKKRWVGLVDYLHQPNNAETRRKLLRTFATALELLERFEGGGATAISGGVYYADFDGDALLGVLAELGTCLQLLGTKPLVLWDARVREIVAATVLTAAQA